MAIINKWEQRGLHTRYVGLTPAAELLSSAQGLTSDMRYDDLKYIIGDWSESESSDIEPEDIQELVALIKALSITNPRIINAVILPKDSEQGQALTSFYVLLTEDIAWPTKWFATIEDARDWIESVNAGKPS